jgi:formamidase
MSPIERVRVDAGKPLADQPGVGHNRWHPDIEPVVSVEPGVSITLETLDAMDGQLIATSDEDDVATSNLNRVHPLTGPVYVKGAEPGDLLVINIEDLETSGFGFTAQIPGFGFLRDVFADPYYVSWKIADHLAESSTLPGVRIPEQAFLGVMGVAPSASLLASIAAREKDLADRGGAVHPPEPQDAVPDDARIAAEALRTTPPRETGGNLDVRQLGIGTTLVMPVFVDGALFSCGDLHFAQGDGECCGTAIEVYGSVRLSFGLRKGEAHRRRSASVWFTTPARDADAPRHALGCLGTTGVCVDSTGRNESENATLAARNALLAMIERLVSERGYTEQQAYAICSVAADLRYSQVVDVPNFTASAILPLDIFV